MQRFLPFVPGGPEAAEAALLLSQDLEWLLSTDAVELWAVVRSDPSLIAFIESYLRAAPRPFDDGFAHLSAVERALWHHFLTLLDRL